MTCYMANGFVWLMYLVNFVSQLTGTISRSKKSLLRINISYKIGIGQYSICYRKRPIETGLPEWIQPTLSFSFSAPFHMQFIKLSG